MHENIRLNYIKLMMFERFNKTTISHVQSTRTRGGIGLKFLELNIISEDPCAAVFFLHPTLVCYFTFDLAYGDRVLISNAVCLSLLLNPC